MNQLSHSPYFTFRHVIDSDTIGTRIDVFLAEQFPSFSRGRWQLAIKNGNIRHNGTISKCSVRLYPGDIVEGQIITQQETFNHPENIALDILYSDDNIIIINKLAGLVVHPAAGNPNHTLLNALLYHFPRTQYLPRSGIVHRLDKDTSGIMVVAHSITAHAHLVNQLQKRTMRREYLALVHRHVTAGGTVNEPIGRHPKDRLKMAVRTDGKPAITHYRIIEHFGDTSLLRINLETGRTHQIRVHMSFIRHPLVGDPLYTHNIHSTKTTPITVWERLLSFSRQALHAQKLSLTHPESGEYLTFSSPLPEDFETLLTFLKNSYRDSIS